MLLYVGSGRNMEQKDINLIEKFINRPISNIPTIVYIFNHGHIQHDDWFENIKREGGINNYYDCIHTIHGELLPCSLRNHAKYLIGQTNVIYNQDEVCKNLTGDHRAQVFQRLRETIQSKGCYTSTQWKQLYDENLIDIPNDIIATKEACAGYDGLAAVIRVAHQEKCQKLTTNPLNVYRSVLTNTYHYIRLLMNLQHQKIN
jgi:hypothetical protein